MVEECILRTRANYVSEIRTLQAQLVAANPYLSFERVNDPTSPARRAGISINILGQQNIGHPGEASGENGTGSAGQFHVSQNIGINNQASPDSESEESGNESITTTIAPPQTVNSVTA